MEATNENKQGDSVSGETPRQIKLQIRNSSRSQEFITVDENISVRDLRARVANLFEVDDPKLTVLIFGGKILKDNEDITTHGIKDGQAIHLVIRNKSTTDSPVTSSNLATSQPNQQPTNVNVSSNANNNNIPNNNRQEPLMGNLNDVRQRLQQMLISNPETMQNVMNPMMQQMINNPGMMRSLFGSMQRMQMLLERNPEVNHLLSNPDVLRESLEMVRNPAALQEVMRNYDRALNNMESMPGGYNVLRRMYTDFQEPLLSAFQEQFTTNQFSPQSDGEGANESERGSGVEGRQRTENRDPLPNPWAAPTSQGTRSQFPVGSGLDGVGNLDTQGNLNTTELLQQANGMFQDQEFMSLLTNPEAIQSVEQIQQGFERLQRIAPNLFGRLGLPTLPRSGLLGSVNSTSTTTNQPGVDGAPRQTPAGASRDSFDQLVRLMLAGASGQVGGADNLDANITTPTDTNTGATTTSGNVATDQQSAEAARMLFQMLGNQGQGLGASLAGLGNNPTGTNSGQPPEERYSQQLQQLSEMGFPDRAANLQALIATFGDINAAIARLLPQ